LEGHFLLLGENGQERIGQVGEAQWRWKIYEETSTSEKGEVF
jgi:hypothetical protein